MMCVGGSLCSMSLVVSYDDRVCPGDSQELLLETRLNLLALEYGYRYRLDIRAKNGLARVEFVGTLREARCVGSPVRRAGGTVKFFKISDDGSLKPHRW
jgi:hypothetical protein